MRAFEDRDAFGDEAFGVYSGDSRTVTDKPYVLMLSIKLFVSLA